MIKLKVVFIVKSKKFDETLKGNESGKLHVHAILNGLNLLRYNVILLET